MKGPAVRLLQRRLAALKYYPGRVDGRFGSDTLEAVWAFQETQGLHPGDAVSSAMQRALASPRPPKVLVPHGGRLRVEVNLKDQVLVLYRRDHVALVSHVSSAGGYCLPWLRADPDGHRRVLPHAGTHPGHAGVHPRLR